MSKIKFSPVVKIFLAFFLFWLGGIGGYYLTSYYYANADLIPHRNLPDISQELQQNAQHFFSDDIVVFARDKQGNPFLLKLDLNRKEMKPKGYLHYYWADLLYKDFKTNEYVHFVDDQHDVSARELFTTYKNTTFADLSTRESYDFSLILGGRKIQVQLEGLDGDFIVRNKLEHTKYVSLGKAKISFDGQDLEGQAATAKIYSSDYSKYIFFDSYDTLKSRTHYLTLWDEKGNFYLIDITKTEVEDPAYQSHTWILYKDYDGHFMRKAFDANVVFRQKNNVPESWNIKVPEIFNSEIQLQPLRFLTDDKSEGIAEGTLTTEKGQVRIMGVFKYGIYN